MLEKNDEQEKTSFFLISWGVTYSKTLRKTSENRWKPPNPPSRGYLGSLGFRLIIVRIHIILGQVKTSRVRWTRGSPGWIQLVGWLNQSIWKICSSKWESLPQVEGEHNKNIWNHQPGKGFSQGWFTRDSHVCVCVCVGGKFRKWFLQDPYELPISLGIPKMGVGLGNSMGPKRFHYWGSLKIPLI